MGPEDYDETLIEMTYRWADIESGIATWVRHIGKPNEYAVGEVVAPALNAAFRVEANIEEEWNSYRSELDYVPQYVLLFDVEDDSARVAAKVVRDEGELVAKVISDSFSGGSIPVQIRCVSTGTPAQGQICGRPWEPPPKQHIDVSAVPIERPDSNVPLVEKDGYWLTPIEVPFYDALRESGLIFAVQPWIQGIETRFRLDFLIFYDGGMVAVELDGHETHKTKEQRARDARRDRWFAGRKVRTLRWTGSEVVRNPQDCVRELLEILRGRQART